MKRHRRVGSVIIMPGTVGVCAFSASNPNAVNVKTGESKIWSLEQAHYMLARLRALSAGREASAPTADDLNPNRVRGARFEVLHGFFGLDVDFSQAVSLPWSARSELV